MAGYSNRFCNINQKEVETEGELGKDGTSV
jgi:hypothetical protein